MVDTIEWLATCRATDHRFDPGDYSHLGVGSVNKGRQPLKMTSKVMPRNHNVPETLRIDIGFHDSPVGLEPTAACRSRNSTKALTPGLVVPEDTPDVLPKADLAVTTR